MNEPLINIVLFEPEIPANCGNIIRLAANTGSMLHLIKPLGFSLDDRQLKRAGLDYHEYATMLIYDSWRSFCTLAKPKRLFSCTTKADHHYHAPSYQVNDFFLYGPESRGLPYHLIEAGFPIRIPMLKDSRSLNLANAVSIVTYEAIRQLGFAGLM